MVDQPDLRGVLSEEQCQCLDAVLESAARTAQLIAACKECGLNMATAEKRNREQQELAAALKARFEPTRV